MLSTKLLFFKLFFWKMPFFKISSHCLNQMAKVIWNQQI